MSNASVSDPAAAEATARWLRRQVADAPRVGILTGTGLGDATGALSIHRRIPYSEIPRFPVSTVQSHPGGLIFGELAGIGVMVMQGRVHLYEGYPPARVVFPIRVMRAMGVSILIVSNAAGGLNPDYRPGDLMILTDHINLTGQNPLTGANDEAFGPRFPDMIQAYDPLLGRAAAQAMPAASRGRLRRGVYAGLSGPSLETPAEVRYLRTIGADAVGFSTVMEVIAAVHAGMRVLGLSVITNVHDPDHPRPTSVAGVIEVANAAAPVLEAMIRGVLQGLENDEGRNP